MTETTSDDRYSDRTHVVRYRDGRTIVLELTAEKLAKFQAAVDHEQSRVASVEPLTDELAADLAGDESVRWIRVPLPPITGSGTLTPAHAEAEGGAR